MGKNPTVSIIGGTIWGNRGAESMLTTVIGMVREDYPQARFNIFSYYPKTDRALIEDEAITVLSGKPASLVTRHFFGALVGTFLKLFKIKIPGSNFFKITRALDASDVLIDVGGITFSDGREKFLPFNILTIWPAMMLGVPVVKAAQAMGPFKHWLNRVPAKLFLSRCRFIFARGERTAEHLKDLKIPQDQWREAADIAFLYQPDYSLSQENDPKVDALLANIEQARQEGEKIIVICPSILVELASDKNGLDYKGRILEIARYFEKAGKAHFVFLPNATREGSSKTANNDLLTIQRIQAAAQAMFEKPVFLQDFDWVTYDLNTASIRRITSETDWLFTSRYHSMISGLCLEKKTVVIGWGHKYKETMDYFELGDCCLDFKQQDLDLEHFLEDLLHREKDIEQKLHANKPAVVESAAQQKQFIKDLLL